jgi:pyruvate dehydrogenase E2 component (dihydrolipoamide acetyltransferase)
VTVEEAGQLARRVIRDADRKTILAVADELRRPATDDPIAEISFEIAIVGRGIRQLRASPSPGTVATLAMGTIDEKPVARGGVIHVGRVARFILTCDQRACDWATASLFAEELRRMLEDPRRMIL